MPKHVITKEDLKAMCSPSVRQLNAALFERLDGLGKPKSQPSAQAEHRPKISRKAENEDSMEIRNSPSSPAVVLTSYRRRLLDGDNLSGGFKALRDEIAAFLGLDDSERFIDWKYYQVKVKTKDEEGTAVRITINQNQPP